MNEFDFMRAVRFPLCVQAGATREDLPFWGGDGEENGKPKTAD